MYFAYVVENCAIHPPPTGMTAASSTKRGIPVRFEMDEHGTVKGSFLEDEDSLEYSCTDGYISGEGSKATYCSAGILAAITLICKSKFI